MNSTFKKIITKIKQGYLKEIYAETLWMYQYARRYWKSICFYIFSGIFGTVMGLGSSVMSKYLIDAVTGGHRDRILSLCPPVTASMRYLDITLLPSPITVPKIPENM